MFPRLLLILSLSSVPLAAADQRSFADYLTAMEKSKITYSIQMTAAKDPVEFMTCPPRDAQMRVVASADGERSLIEWKINDKAEKLSDEGEALYAQKEYEKAAPLLKAAMEADPEAAVLYLSYGDALLFGPKEDAAAALELYQKAAALDPTFPRPHFFSATALVRLGRADEAREEIVKALSYDPTYATVWKVAEQAYVKWNAKPILRHPFTPPERFLGKKVKNKVDIRVGPDGDWMGYPICKAVSAYEKAFAEAGKKAEGWSVQEERACVATEIETRYNRVQSQLEEEAKKRSGGAKGIVTEMHVIEALDPLSRHLFEVAKAQLLDGYILFEIIGQHCPLSMGLIDHSSLLELQEYIRRYVIVAAK